MGENTRTSHQKQQGEFTAKGKDFLAGDRTHDLPFSGQGAHRWATEEWVPSKNAKLLGIVQNLPPGFRSCSFLNRKSGGAARRQFRRAINNLDKNNTDSKVCEDTH